MNKKTENLDKKIEKQEVVITVEELFEIIDQAKLETMEMVLHSENFTGPVPHPEHMRLYKEVDETLPDRFTKMAENNLSHKEFIEKLEVSGQLLMGILGWATPTGIGFYTLNAAIDLIKEGRSIEALIALVTAIGTVGTAFYLKKKDK